MKRFNKYVLILVIALTGLVIAFPPYEYHGSWPIVKAVIAETLTPVEAQVDVVSIDGKRRLWRSCPSQVKFYSIGDPKLRDSILASLQKNFYGSSIPALVVYFYTKPSLSRDLDQPITFSLRQETK